MTPSKRMRAYKIFEQAPDGSLKALFHGVNRSRKLDTGRWLNAGQKWVRDGTGPTWYMSGFQVFSKRDIAEKYLERFTSPRKIVILPVGGGGEIRVKPSNSNVLLAQKIRIIKGEGVEQCRVNSRTASARAARSAR